METNLTQKTSDLTDADKQQAINGANAAWNSIHYDDLKAINNVDNNNVYYKAAYSGFMDAWNQYNTDNNSKGTQPVKNYASDSYRRSDGQQIINPNDPNSVDPYLNSGKFSVDANSMAIISKDPNASNQTETKDILVSATTDATRTYINGRNQVVSFDLNDPNKKSVYNQAVSTFLRYQGTYDAENGRWNGKNINDAYTPDKTSDNAYDQAYLGAQDAISKQFTKDDKLTYQDSNGNINKFNPTPSSQSINYLNGFNDVVNKVNSGTAFVSNGAQINNSIFVYSAVVSSQNPNNSNSYGNQLVAKGTWNLNGKINNIRFVKDFDFTRTNLGSLSEAGLNNTGAGIEGIYWMSNSGITGTTNLTFDGQNHMSDFDNVCYDLQNDNGKSDTTFNIKNFSALYGRNFYGTMKLQTSGTINYSNVTYIGPQLTNATGGNVNVYNNLNVFSVGNYLSPFKKGLNNVTVSNGNVNGPIVNGWIDTEASNTLKISNNSNVTENTQENFEVSNFNMNKNSSYYGVTTGGTAVNIYSGNFNVKNGSTVKLVPMRSDIGQSTGDDTANGIYLQSGNLNIQNGGKVSIIPKGSSNYAMSAAQALYDKGSINIDGGLLYIDLGSTPSVGNANYISGSVTVKNNGMLSINATNLGNFGGSILNASSGALNITNRGNFSIITDGSGSNPTLLNNSNNFNIDNPGDKVTLQIKPINGNPGSGTLFTSGITAYSVKYAMNTTGNISNSDGSNFYQVQVPNSDFIKHTNQDGNKNINTLIQSNDNTTNIKYLSFNGAPNMSFVGGFGVQVDNGKNIVYGKVALNNLPHIDDSNKDNGIGYLQIYCDGQPLNANDIQNGTLTLIHTNSDGSVTTTSIPVGNINNSSSIVHAGKQVSANSITDNSGNWNSVNYSDGIKIPNSAVNGDIIKFSYVLPSQPPKNNVTVQTHYFVTDQRQSVDINGNFKNALENPYKGEDLIDSTTVNQGKMIPSITFDDARNQGYTDGQNDSNKYYSDSSDPSKTNYYSKLPDDDTKEIYSDAYNQAFKNYKQGQHDYLNKNAFNNDISSAASNAYSDGYASISAADTAAQSNFYAQNSSGNTYAGLQFSAYNDIYGAASSAFKDYNNGNGSSAAPVSSTPVAKSVYNDVYSTFAGATSSAKYDFETSGNQSNNFRIENNSMVVAAYDKAYIDVASAAAQAKSDFQKNGQSSSYDYPSNSSAAYEAYSGDYAAYSQALQDINSGVSRQSNKNLNYTSTNYLSYYQEYNALVAAKNAGQTDGQNVAASKIENYASDQAAKTIYLNTYNKYIQATASSKAVQEFNNAVNTNSLTSYSDAGAQAAYTNARISVSNAAEAAAKDYKSNAGSSAAESLSGDAKLVYTSVYGAMSQAAADYNSGNGSNASGSHGYNSQTANYYISAYTDLINAASQASVNLGDNKGSDASYASGYSAVSSAYSQAYSNVSSAADQAKSDFQKNGTSSSYDYSANSLAASTAYQNAYKAYEQAVTDFNGGSGDKQSQSSLSSYTNANYSSYSSEYDALSKAAQDGSKAAFSNGASTSSSGDKAADNAYENAYNNVKNLVNNAHKVIQDALNSTTASIESDATLTDQEKTNQKAAAKSDADVANNNIKTAQSAQNITDAQNNGVKVVNGDYKPGKKLDDQKSAANAQIDAEANKVQQQIDNDKNLDTDAKNKQKSDVIKAANAAKESINNANNAQAILDVIPVGITNVDKVYQPGKPIEYVPYVPSTISNEHDAVKDFNDGIKRNDTSIIYDQNYKNVRSGFNDGIKGLTAAEKTSKVYMDGYKMAVDGLAGMKAAKSIDKVDINELSGKSADFNAGFNGYLAGLKAAIKGTKDSDNGYGPVYKFTYDKGYEGGQKQAIKQASSAGRKQAESGKKMPSLSGYSKEYVKAYKQAFNEANRNANKSYNVISESGIYVHSSAEFTKDNRVRKLKKGAKFSVKRVVKVNGITRYYINDKEYVTSDPNMVSNLK
ncbi:DUF5776 domain-containing protein [Apilactobacillus xinyiensis]|uniref:DUF5776 domain-containing protein n=1 Tax=Apilactobacillus xinyiensis TaxID=2841032 RepID=UPI00200C6B19|nr:DUF5776 domain-containing protein [Apilactobacillus xinyiensis]MCL0330266.1 DUF5776 domain-containing protein [Apilactobacillus xinyiensis]